MHTPENNKSSSAVDPIMSVTGSISHGEKPEAVAQDDVEKTEQHEVYDLTPEQDKALLRKIDRFLLPVMALSYFFQFLDKTALGGAAILGIRTDLHLSGSEYSWSSAIYYFGYLVASYPAAVLMVRWKVGKIIACSVAIWGAILMLTAVCHNAAGLLGTRFFLGFVESAIAPGLTIVISMWYKRSEQPLRHAAWFLGNTIAGIFGGLLQYGIGHIKSIAPWKGVFLILGGITVAWGICIFFLLPDTPMSARFLPEGDRAVAVARVKENKTGIKSNEVKWDQVKEALLDVKLWLMVLSWISYNIPNGGITTFGTIVIQGFGFSTFHTLLLSSVPYIVQLVLIIITSTASSYLPNTRTIWMAVCSTISLVGAILVRYLPAHNRWGRFVGVALSPSYAATFPLVMSLLSGNFGGFTKKTTSNAIMFIAYCAGNIIGPQLFFDNQAPTYNSAFLGLIICLAFSVFFSLVLRYYLILENKRRDRNMSEAETMSEEDAEREFMLNLADKTDKQIPHFRYVY